MMERTSNPRPAPSSLLCEHPEGLVRHGKMLCNVCQSFYDLSSVASPFCYEPDYPQKRLHFDPGIGSLKVKTLTRWLQRAGIVITPHQTVCEVGFGAGFTLRSLYEKTSEIFGIEAILLNIDHAVSLGLPRKQLFHTSSLPPKLPQPVDLWLFQDSWEHLSGPGDFLAWMEANSSPSSRILLVMPRADSLSQKLFGRFWVHRLKDHPFHWSRKGIVEFMTRRNFSLTQSFFPWKYISTRMVLSHLALLNPDFAIGASTETKEAEAFSTQKVRSMQGHRTNFLRKKKSGILRRMPRPIAKSGLNLKNWAAFLGLFPDVTWRFNMGEMGLVFQREPQP